MILPIRANRRARAVIRSVRIPVQTNAPGAAPDGHGDLMQDEATRARVLALDSRVPGVHRVKSGAMTVLPVARGLPAAGNLIP